MKEGRKEAEKGREEDLMREAVTVSLSERVGEINLWRLKSFPTYVEDEPHI